MTTGTMTENARRYIDRVKDLFELVRNWMKEIDPKAELTTSDVIVNAGELGTYEAPLLSIKRPQAEEIYLVPIGHHTLAAHGRVDIKSRLGTETLVYLPEGGLVLEQQKECPTPEIAEGWVWLDDLVWKARSLPSLDRDTFFKLLASLSE